MKVEARAEPSPREAYLDRRKVAEEYFNKTPLHKEVKHLSDGSDIEIRYGSFDFPEDAKATPGDPNTIRIEIFMPGVFHYPKSESTNINDSRENKMLGATIRGDIDKVILLKPSGLNKQSYLDEAGNGVCQEKVAQVALDFLKQQLGADPNTNYEFSLVGYSEGSTQAASLAAKILEQNVGKVKKVTSICALGITGADSQQDVPSQPITPILKNMKAGKAFQAQQFPLQNEEGANLYHYREEDDLTVDQKLLANETDGLEKSLGERKLSGLDKWVRDPKILTTWISRYLGSTLLKNGVPNERVKAALTRNPDWEVLAKSGVAIRVFIAQRDWYYTAEQMTTAIQKLRSLGGQIKTVASDVGHEFPHVNPSSVGWITSSLD
jgi:pimeloyl-ACP methyl ester carboxylesterase